jgi:hypothetical protein
LKHIFRHQAGIVAQLIPEIPSQRWAIFDIQLLQSAFITASDPADQETVEPVEKGRY